MNKHTIVLLLSIFVVLSSWVYIFFSCYEMHFIVKPVFFFLYVLSIIGSELKIQKILRINLDGWLQGKLPW